EVFFRVHLPDPGRDVLRPKVARPQQENQRRGQRFADHDRPPSPQRSERPLYPTLRGTGPRRGVTRPNFFPLIPLSYKLIRGVARRRSCNLVPAAGRPPRGKASYTFSLTSGINKAPTAELLRRKTD